MRIKDVLTLASYIKLEEIGDEEGKTHYFINDKAVNVEEYRQISLIMETIEREFSGYGN